MISTDFAANESREDALLSLSLLVRPWRWTDLSSLVTLEKKILSFFPKLPLKATFFLSGRSALYNLLSSLELKKGSQVLVQGFTCEAVVLPIIKAGYVPVFIDINKETFSIDIDDLKKKYDKWAKVLILQHTFGITPDRKTILDFCKENNLIVIEDLAHGFDNEIFDKDSQETIKLLSFGRSKAYSSVFGGAVLTTDHNLHSRLQEVVAGLSFPNRRFIIRVLLYKPLTVLIKSLFDSGIGKIIHKIVSQTGLLIPEITEKEKSGKYDSFTDYKYTSPLALLMLLQLRKYDKTRTERKNSVESYKALLKEKLLVSNAPLIRFPFRVNDRKALIRYMSKKNVYLGSWYDQVIGPRGLDIESLGYRMGSCPVAEEISKDIVNLPTLISEKEVRYVAKKLLHFYEN